MTYLNANSLHIPLADNTVQCVVTSPPYYGLRDYKVSGQLGLEQTPALYVANLVSVFREVWRVLRDDGTVWLNIGDSYASEGKGNNNGRASSSLAGGWDTQESNPLKFSKMGDGAKRKNLLGIPWRVAFALQDDGWYLRSDIIWHKPNPMPESVTDRPTKAHEYVFLLTKSERYFYDAEAIKEQVAESTGPRLLRGVSDNHKNINGAPGQTAHTMNQPRENKKTGGNFSRAYAEAQPNHGAMTLDRNDTGTRNKRTVWTVATSPYSGTRDDWANYDYVGQGGKPYRASLDCPVHGHLARARMSDTPEYDEQSIDLSRRNLGTYSRPDSSQATLPAATTSRNSPDEGDGSVLLKKTESTDASKTQVDRLSPISDGKSFPRTNHKQGDDGQTDDSPDLQTQPYSEIAKQNNNQIRKTARAHQTSIRDNASAQMPDHTPSNQPSGESFDLVDRNSENNTSVDCASDEKAIDPSEKRTFDSARIEIVSLSDCTCKPAKTQVDHFATFPPKLIEPMILAGSRRGDVVLDPFMGSGTTAQVAIQHGRRAVGCELSMDYIKLAQCRTAELAVVML